MHWRKHFILFLLLIVPGATAAEGQACGGSEKPIFIYVRAGFALQNPRYELFSVSPTGHEYNDGYVANFLSRTFFPEKEANPANFWVTQSLVVAPDRAETFLKTYKPADYDPKPNHLPIKREQLSGPASDGVIIFQTGELYNFPYLLKIFADNRKPVYILGAHLGGCYSVDRIILDRTEVRVISEQRPGRVFSRN